MGPRVDALSNYQVTPGQQIYAYGAGFTGATSVTVGGVAATHVFGYDDVTIGFTVPDQPGGSSNWVVVTAPDGSASPCVGDAQLVTYLDQVFDPPRGALRLDSVTPSPIVAGRADSYWLLGAGLSAVDVVIIDGHACDFQTHDDARLVFQVPEFRHDSAQPTAELRVHTAEAHATLAVPCVPIADVLPTDDPPWLGHLDPQQLPASGGRLVLHGGALRTVTHVSIGGAEATIVEVHDDQVIVTVGSLADHVHGEVAVTAVTPHAATPMTDLTMLRVAEG